jgi:hypothetical protein
MEKTVVVFYKGSPAHYNICMQKNGSFIARLLKYNGKSEKEPPQKFTLHKIGRKWVDQQADEELVEDVGQAIEYDPGIADQPVYRSEPKE